MNGGGPPAVWMRILRRLVRGEEGERVEEALAELYALRRDEAPGTEDAWYRRQVLGFALRLPFLARAAGRRRRGWGADALRQDFGFAVRQVRRRPGFASMVVLTAGLGIGAATAIFAVVRAVVLAPLPYPDAERLVAVLEQTPGGDDFVTSERNFLDFRERNRTFVGMAAFQFYEVATRLGGEAVQLRALRATADLFPVLGGRAALGRVFTTGEAGVAPAHVVVLSHRVWRDAFGADASALGRSILLDGVTHTVIGVMPSGWQPFGETDLWLPQRLDPGVAHGRMLNVVGRLAEGQTVVGARSDLSAIQSELGARYPDSNGGWGVEVRSLEEEVLGADTIRAGWVLLGAAGLLLLLSCASVSNLLIARGMTRGREIALRTALGASTGRVLRQLITESVVLALAGGVLGVSVAFAAVPVLQALSPADTPRIAEVRVDALVLLFAMTVSLAAGLLFGATPAVHALRRDVRSALAEDGRTTAHGRDRLRELLVAGQVAVAVTLLVGVGLLAASYIRLQAADTGLAIEDTLVVPLSLPAERYSAEDRLRLAPSIQDRVAALPGVRAAGFVNIAPFGDWNTVVDLSVEGMAFPENDAPFARWRAVTPGYFQAAGVTIVAGRALEPGDRGPGGGDRAAAVVTLAMAEGIWGSAEAALGRRFAMSRNSTNWMRIVGVATDLEDNIVAESAVPLFFFPDGGWWPAMSLLVRADRSAASLAPAIRRAVWEVDADLPVPTVEPLAARLGRQAAGPRFRFALMFAFGAAALVLAILGVYGVTHVAVSRRTREIGIRLALGAGVGGMVRMVVSRSAGFALAGAVIGALFAVAGGRAVQPLLFRTSGVDPAIMAAAAAVVLGASVVAAWVPARGATRVDPAAVLRGD